MGGSNEGHDSDFTTMFTVPSSDVQNFRSRLKNPLVLSLTDDLFVVDGCRISVSSNPDSSLGITVVTNHEDFLQSAVQILGLPVSDVCESKYRRREKEELKESDEILRFGRCLIENDAFYARAGAKSRSSLSWVAEVSRHFIRGVEMDVLRIWHEWMV